MEAERGYDTTNLQTLRHELERLNEVASARGFGMSSVRSPARRAETGVSRQAAKSDAPPAPQGDDPAAAAEAAVVDKKVAAKRRSSRKAIAGPNAEVNASAAGSPAAEAETSEAPAPKGRSEGKSSKPRTARASATSHKKAPADLPGTPAEASTATAAKQEGAAPKPATRRKLTAPADKGKAGARRLLRMLRRTEDDVSPLVPGTDFTESGVVRLLAHLRAPRTRRNRFLQRLHRLLTQPLAMGTQTRAGVGVERLQRVSRQLQEIDENGWHHFQSIRAGRRGGVPLGPAVPDAATAAADRSESSAIQP